MTIDSPPTIRIDLPQIPSSNHTLVVRPIMVSEREAWDTLMDRHHYLGFRVIVGESLRYVAFLGKRPVALIGWGTAAFKSRHRDEWIGWEAHLKWRRLCFIAIDGKTLKASARKGERQVHLLVALLHHEQVVIAQLQVDAKSNEIPAMKLLLEPLDIQGAVVTADAMHTQKNTATFIVNEKKAEYFFTVKDNQETLNNDIKTLHIEAFPPSA